MHVCGSSGKDHTTASPLYDLSVINNGCDDVTASVDGNHFLILSPNTTIQAPAGVTVDLDAEPPPNPGPPGVLVGMPQWAGTSSPSSPTTYLMTPDANQTVAVTCP